MLRPRTRPTRVPTLKFRVEHSLAEMAAMFAVRTTAPTRPVDATKPAVPTESSVTDERFAPSTFSS